MPRPRTLVPHPLAAMNIGYTSLLVDPGIVHKLYVAIAQTVHEVGSNVYYTVCTCIVCVVWRPRTFQSCSMLGCMQTSVMCSV